jgi:Tol biopolymer transport system component
MFGGKLKNSIKIIGFSLVALCCGIFLNCNVQNDGRGYRYVKGGSYYGSNPSFSSNGKKIVFGSIRTGVGNIFLIDSDGTNEKRLTNTSAYEGEPSFSPDDSKIVFISERINAAYGKIYIMKADGSNQRQLTYGNSYDFAPKFSPDGRKIIFVRDQGEYQTDIYIIDIDGSNQQRLTYDENPKGYLHFLKGGKKISFSSINLKTQESEIYEINTDGSNPTLILKLPLGYSEAAYSPDEEKIVLISSNTTDYFKDFYTRTEVFIMNSDGTHIRQLTDTKTYKSYPTFSSDGKEIMFLSHEKDGRGKGQIIIMNSDGSDSRIVANNY